MSHLQCLVKSADELGEGPLFSDGYIYWVDIKRYLLQRYHLASGKHESRKFEAQLTSIHERKDGGFIVTTRRGFANLKDFESELELITEVSTEPEDSRFNDAKVDPYGALWAGTMDDHETDITGSVYRLEASGSVTQVDTGYAITNGPTFSLDGRTMYQTDSRKKQIYRFDLTEEGVSGKSLFYEFPDGVGSPDGMTTDAEGCLWICHYGGSRVSRVSDVGECLSHIEVPTRNVTSCVFGGDDLNQLFITTAAKNHSPEDREAEPLVGCLFVAEPGVKGLPTNQFG